jgi:TPR repeat protein
VKWLTMAAEKGNAYAQLSLARLYSSGTGVQRNLQKAHSLFNLAGKTLDVSKQLTEISSQFNREGANPQPAPEASSDSRESANRLTGNDYRLRRTWP